MANSEFLEVQENSLSIGLATPAPEVLLTPNIGVIGVGGAGGNAVNNMVTADLGDVSFFVANTDAQALSKSLVADKIQLGVTLTQGLGAGANPEVGKAAALEASEKIKEYLKGLHLLFITAGMGGGTGTGAAPVIAGLAKEMGVLTVGVVSKPFRFEGKRRMTVAEEGIQELKKHVDTLIVIPNQNLFRIIASNTTFADAFKIADGVLCQGVRSITDLVMYQGLVNLDFADVKTVLSSMGRAMMGTGEASGENRAEIAVEKAISNPLLDDSSIQGATSILINISGGSDLTLEEVDLAAERIRQELHQDDANIIFGTCTDEALHGKIRVSLVATGIEDNGDVHYIPPQPSVETIVNVPVAVEEKKEDLPPVQVIEEKFPLIQEESEVSPEPRIESGYNFEENTIPLAVDLTQEAENSVAQPPLFAEEAPRIAPIISVAETPEVKEPINLASKTVIENVKPAKTSLMDMLFPLNRKSVRKPQEEPTFTEPFLTNSEAPLSPAADTVKEAAPAVAKQPESREELFDPYEIPAFLRPRN